MREIAQPHPEERLDRVSKDERSHARPLNKNKAIRTGRADVDLIEPAPGVTL